MICPAHGWWAVFRDDKDSGANHAERVMFWESDEDGRTGIVYDGEELVGVETYAGNWIEFFGYHYDPVGYDTPDVGGYLAGVFRDAREAEDAAQAKSSLPAGLGDVVLSQLARSTRNNDDLVFKMTLANLLDPAGDPNNEK